MKKNSFYALSEIQKKVTNQHVDIYEIIKIKKIPFFTIGKEVYISACYINDKINLF